MGKSKKKPLLDFHKAQGATPETPCNMCGLTKPVAYTADHPQDSEIMVVVCSGKCRDMLLGHAGLKQWLANLFRNIQNLKRSESEGSNSSD